MNKDINLIKHIIEPEELYLLWQAPNRRNFIVAKIYKDDRFVYLQDDEDYKEALKQGFEGYPAFSTKKKEYKSNIIATFITRCPPRYRSDLNIYFRAIRVPFDEYKDKEKFSDFALLAYSAAKIPDDPFMIINPFSNIEPPFELMIEVAGFRYQDLEIEDFKIGQKAVFEKEYNNSYDANAVKIKVEGKKIGYVMKGLNKTIGFWIDKGYKIKSVVERKNGTKERPLIHLFTEVTN